MNPKTDRNPNAAVSPAPGQTPAQPRLAYLIATVLGAGYSPVGPGTCGSLVGLVVYAGVSFGIPIKAFALGAATSPAVTAGGRALRVSITCAMIAVLAFIGVWAANRVAAFSGIKDPQFVVIDETWGNSWRCFWRSLRLTGRVAEFYTFQSVRHLEAFSGSPSGVTACGMGNHGERLGGWNLCRAGIVAGARRGVIASQANFN